MVEKNDFDFGAWLGAATRPERSVMIFGANALQADIDRLESERADMLREHDGGDSWGDAGPDTSRIDKQLADLRKKLAASGVEFRVRALDMDDQDKVNRAYPLEKGASDETINEVMNKRAMAELEIQIVGPRTFTLDELFRLRKAVGPAEFLKLYQAAQETMSTDSASSPFWRGNSGSSRR